MEYVPESMESEVLEFWSEHSKARCVILLCQKEKHAYNETKIYCRSDEWGEKLQHADRYEPPAPLEFEIYENPGHRSVDELLEALHRGNENLVGEMIAQWRSAMKEAHFLAAQVQEEKPDSGDDDERALHRICHRLFHHEPFRFSGDSPPLLLWDEQFREQRYWSGDLEDINEKTRANAKKLLGDASRLGNWLRGKIGRNALITGGLLGRYDPSSRRIELYPAILDALGPLLGLQPRYLKNVVFIQLSVRAIAHQAHDCDGQPGFGFAVASAASPFQRESPAHIVLSQYFVFRLIERLGDISLMGAFEKLSEKQPEPYRRWRSMRRIPVEQMRAALLRARLGEAALGLPGAELD